jgi:hypothetical protein
MLNIIEVMENLAKVYGYTPLSHTLRKKKYNVTLRPVLLHHITYIFSWMNPNSQIIILFSRIRTTYKNDLEINIYIIFPTGHGNVLLTV